MHRLKREKKLFQTGLERIGGIDEAGRGPLAGPVVAACVAIASGYQFKNKRLKKVNDSKILNEKIREELYDLIINDDGIEVGVGICSPAIIDRINIFQANFLAMKKALAGLKNPPEYIFVDGKFCLPNCRVKQEAVVGGDGKIFLVAAASIVAKVTRDRIMRELHNKYPVYGFNDNKGYPTKSHFIRLRKFGPSKVHRRSFQPVREAFLKVGPGPAEEKNGRDVVD